MVYSEGILAPVYPTVLNILILKDVHRSYVTKIRNVPVMKEQAVGTWVCEQQ